MPARLALKKRKAAVVEESTLLQCRFNFKSPRLKQRLRDVLGILVAPGPLAQTSRAQVLVGREFVLADHLLEFSHGGNNGPDGFGLAPVRISASLSHERSASYS